MPSSTGEFFSARDSQRSSFRGACSAAGVCTAERDGAEEEAGGGRREAGGQASGTHAGKARRSVVVQTCCALSFSAQTLLLASPGGVDALFSARANQRSILDIARRRRAGSVTSSACATSIQ